MHPPLHTLTHPGCRQEIARLLKCHKANPFAKFLGVCNEAKYELDRCLKRERKRKRAMNRSKAEDFKQSIRQLHAALKEDTRS